MLLTRLVSSTSIFINYYSPKSAAEGNLFTTLISLSWLINFYTSSNVAWLITDVIIKYYIKKNIGTFIIDTIIDNNKLIKTITIIFPTIDPKWARLQCARYIINLIIKAVLFSKSVSKL